jgi:hypothetical protein
MYIAFPHITTSHIYVQSTILYSQHQDESKKVTERESDVPLHEIEAWTPDIKACLLSLRLCSTGRSGVQWGVGTPTKAERSFLRRRADWY